MISYTAEVKCKSWLEHCSESSTVIQTPIEHSQISMKRKFLTWFLTLPKSSVKVEWSTAQREQYSNSNSYRTQSNINEEKISNMISYTAEVKCKSWLENCSEGSRKRMPRWCQSAHVLKRSLGFLSLQGNDGNFSHRLNTDCGLFSSVICTR